MSTVLHATLVTAPDCHLCAHARSVLQRIAQSGVTMEIEELGWHDIEGAALVSRDSVQFPPALFIDGDLWGYGRLSERALRKRLAPRNRPRA